MVAGAMMLRGECDRTGAKWLDRGLEARGCPAAVSPATSSQRASYYVAHGPEGRCTTQLPGGSRAINNRM